MHRWSPVLPVRSLMYVCNLYHSINSNNRQSRIGLKGTCNESIKQKQKLETNKTQGWRSRSGRGSHGCPTFWASFSFFFFNQLVICQRHRGLYCQNLMLPATNTVSERSFSALRRIKHICVPRWPRQGWTASWWFILISTLLISWTLSTLVTISCGDRNTVSLY